MSELLSTICAGGCESFGLISRSGSPVVEVYAGAVREVDCLAEIPLPADATGPAVLVAVPFRQITERGFSCHDDHTPLRCLLIDETDSVPAAAALSLLPNHHSGFTGSFATSDSAYASTVARIIDEEIACGAGANFVIRRDYTGTFTGTHLDAALSVFRRLLATETGAYWTFAFVTPDIALVGATPERHVSATDGEVMMNPISGTYRHTGVPADDRAGLLRFLADTKEIDELHMVVDEELKMMAAVCEQGGRMIGPYLKQMGHLTHTEYLLRGRSSLDVREILHRTMFAPTVTGSPVQNAARVIGRYEPGGRGYYSGVLALLGADDNGQTLDAPILIRTAELSSDGKFTASAGATLVRNSNPDSEAAETRAELAGLLQALRGDASGQAPRDRGVEEDPQITAALMARNTMLAPFWTQHQPTHVAAGAPRIRVALVNAEDEWTAMLAHQVRSLGMVPHGYSWSEPPGPGDADIVIAGPGPGDPENRADPRIDALGKLIAGRLAQQLPLLAVCLSHQILAAQLGFPITQLARPHQGTQLQIELFGHPEHVGFYNSFAAIAEDPAAPGGVEVSSDPHTGVVHALRGPGLRRSNFTPNRS